MRKWIRILLALGATTSAFAAAPTRIDSLISTNAIVAGSSDGTAANSKSIFEARSTTKGFLFPRMTQTQRDAISSPPDGLIVFNTDTDALNQYSMTASAWTSLSAGSVTDDNSTNATVYPVWVDANTGSPATKVSSTQLFFNPSTGTLTSTNSKLNGYLATARRDESSASTINALDSTHSLVKLTATVTTVNGITAGDDGQVIVIYNNTGSSVTINNASVSATAANRIITSDGNAITLKTATPQAFVYDAGQSRWIVWGGGGGGVTSVALSDGSTSPLFTISGSPVTATGALVFTLKTQAKNTVIAGPSSGADAQPTARLLAGADLPNPSGSSLGGVQSLSSLSHNFLTSISTTGVPTQAQPAFGDISGSVAASQLPNPSASTLGGVQSIVAVTHNFLTQISTSGVVSQAQPAFSDLSGSASSTQMPAYTGDATSSAGATVLTLASNVVTNAKAAQMAALTIKGNNTASTANSADLSTDQVAAMLPLPQDFLTNGSFEAATYSTGWTITTATGAVETSNIQAGTQSAKLTFSASTGDISQSVTPSQNLAGIQLESSCFIKTTLSTIQVCALVGGVEFQCLNAPASGNFTDIAVPFPAPANGTSIGVRAKTSTSTTGVAYTDNCHVRPSTRLASGYLATDWSNQYTFTPANFGTVSGAVYQTRRVGDSLEVRYFWVNGTPAGSTASLALPTGLQIDSSKIQSASNGTVLGMGAPSNSSLWFSNNLAHFIFYDGSDVNNVYFATSGSSHIISKVVASSISSGSDSMSGNFTIPIKGWSSSQAAYRMDATPASWAGYHTQGGATAWTVTNSSYADFSATGTAAIVQTGNTNFGIVSTAASNKPGLSLTFPRALGSYRVCAFPNAYVGTGNSAIELWDGTSMIAEIALQSTSRQNYSICGRYVAPAGVQTLTLRGRSPSGSVNMDTISGTTLGSIYWTIDELDAPMPAPYLTGGALTGNTTGAERFERVSFGASGGTLAVPTPCSSSPCTMYSNTSGITGITRNGTGSYVVAFAAGTFSAIPTCMGIDTSGSDRLLVSDGSTSRSTTSVQYLMKSGASGSNTDSSGEMFCMGPH